MVEEDAQFVRPDGRPGRDGTNGGGDVLMHRVLTFLVAFSLVGAGLAAAGALAQVFGGPYFQTFLSVPSLLVAALFILALGLINFRGLP